MPLTRFGWDPDFEALFENHAREGLVPGRVLTATRESYRLATPLGELAGELSGRLRFATDSPADLPAVGDWVAARTYPGDGLAVVDAVLPRRTALVRRAAGRRDEAQLLAANVDLLLVAAPLDGDLRARRIERFLALAREAGVPPAVVLTKADLAADPAASLAAAREIAGSAPVVAVSVPSGPRPRRAVDAARPPPYRGPPRALRRRQVDPRKRPPRRGAPGDARGPRRGPARPPRDDAPRALRSSLGGASRRHPRPAGARALGRLGRHRRDLRRGHRPRPGVPLPRLPPRGRAGLRGPRGCGRGQPRRWPHRGLGEAPPRGGSSRDAPDPRPRARRTPPLEADHGRREGTAETRLRSGVWSTFYTLPGYPDRLPPAGSRPAGEAASARPRGPPSRCRRRRP